MGGLRERERERRPGKIAEGVRGGVQNEFAFAWVLMVWGFLYADIVAEGGGRGLIWIRDLEWVGGFSWLRG